MSTDNNDWAEGFEGFLKEQLELSEKSYLNNPIGPASVRPRTLKMVMEAFQWHKNSKIVTKETNPTCITDPRSHFDWLVKFIEDVRQDSLRGDGLASEASSEVCRVILEHAESIRKQGN